MYETEHDYDVRWPGGTVTTEPSLGQLLRTLANNEGTEPVWSQLEGRQFELAQDTINQRDKRVAPVVPVRVHRKLEELERAVVDAAILSVRQARNFSRGLTGFRAVKAGELALVLAVTALEEARDQAKAQARDCGEVA
jgi:hypothetical protein